MNKLLRELFDQSVDYTKLQPNGTFEFNSTKFAELIVDECIKLAEADEDRYLEMGEPDLALAMQNYQAMIKQHFGVKE